MHIFQKIKIKNAQTKHYLSVFVVCSIFFFNVKKIYYTFKLTQLELFTSVPSSLHRFQQTFPYQNNSWLIYKILPHHPFKKEIIDS